MAITWKEARDFIRVIDVDVQEIEDHLGLSRGTLSRVFNFDPLGRPSPERWEELRGAVLTLREQKDQRRAEESERILALGRHWRN